MHGKGYVFMNQSYADFAELYDEFMDATPYEAWCGRLTKLIAEYGISKPYPAEIPEHPKEDTKEALDSERNLVLDLGCGTGTLTEMLADAGFDMIGIDLSEEMLQIAMEKRETAGHSTMYFHQDMRALELYCTVGTVICMCDSINYILKDEEVIETFKRVNNYLFPKGLFIFDFNTDYKYREVIGEATIAENREECSFIWENYYDEESRINEYDLTFFVREEGEEDLFRRFQELHLQRGYTFEEMRSFIEKAGLSFVCAMDGDEMGEVRPDSQRIWMVARECGK